MNTGDRSMQTSMELVIHLDRYGDDVHVRVRGSRGEQTAPRPLGPNHRTAALLHFAEQIRLCAKTQRPLDPALRDESRALERALLDRDVGATLSRLRDVARGPVMVRFELSDPELQSIPWEALCKSNEALGYWGSAPDILPVRGIVSSEPWTPAVLEDAVRILVIAPDPNENLAGFQGALHDRIQAREIEWLEPIQGKAALARHLFARLRREPHPHVIHFIGHGRLQGDVPELCLDADAEHSDERWLPVEWFAQQLQASFRGSLRLVVLESCEGAAPAPFASAAEILARAGAEAVVAHLWPIGADMARMFAVEMYRALTENHAHAGHIAMAVNDARRMILGARGGSADAFSPVLYLRNSSGMLFDFSQRLSLKTNRPQLPSGAYEFSKRPREMFMPTASLIGPPAVQSTYLTNDSLIQLWRPARVRDELRFVPPAGGFSDKPQDTSVRQFSLGPGSMEVFLGREADHKGHRNDFVLPHKKVSQQCLKISVRNGRTFVQRLENCGASITVGMEPLAAGETRPLYHGQIITIGNTVSGVFVDGRYTQPQVAAHTVDPETGLLGRDGLAWEVSIRFQLGDPPPLFLLQVMTERADEELAASRIALALHVAVPTQPIARLDGCVIMILAGPEALTPLLAIAQKAAGTPLAAGHYRAAVETSANQAAAYVEKARSALARVARLGAIQSIVDLTQHVPALQDLSRFEREARDIVQGGGESILIGLAECDRLDELAAGVGHALEMEVISMIDRQAGRRAILTRVLPGVIACAASESLDAVMRKVAASWRALGPVRGKNVEIERRIYWELVRGVGIADLERRAAELASGPTARIESLPLPIALRLRAAFSEKVEKVPSDMASAFVDLVRTTVQLIAIIFSSMLVGSSKHEVERELVVGPGGTLEEWLACAAQAAAKLSSTPGPTGILVAAFFDKQGGQRNVLAEAVRLANILGDALEQRPIVRATLHREAQNLRRVLDEFVVVLGTLRGWTLVAVDRSDKLDPHGSSEVVSYIDYTGSFESGTWRRITLTSKKVPLGPFVYLWRFTEGITVPLEPFVRRRLCPTCGDEKLFLCEQLVSRDEPYRLRGTCKHELVDEDLGY